MAKFIKIVVYMLLVVFIFVNISPTYKADSIEEDYLMWQNHLRKLQDETIVIDDIDEIVKGSNDLQRNQKLVLYKAILQQYIDSGFDFMGGKGEDIFFTLRDGYSEGNWFKEIEFERKTTDLQVEMLKKCYEDNWIMYAGLLGFKGLKGYYKGLNRTQQSIFKKTEFKILKFR